MAETNSLRVCESRIRALHTRPELEKVLSRLRAVPRPLLLEQVPQAGLIPRWRLLLLHRLTFLYLVPREAAIARLHSWVEALPVE